MTGFLIRENKINIIKLVADEIAPIHVLSLSAFMTHSPCPSFMKLILNYLQACINKCRTGHGNIYSRLKTMAVVRQLHLERQF